MNMCGCFESVEWNARVRLAVLQFLFWRTLASYAMVVFSFTLKLSWPARLLLLLILSLLGGVLLFNLENLGSRIATQSNFASTAIVFSRGCLRVVKT